MNNAMPKRFQFSLKSVLWLMFSVACFLAGLMLGRDRKGNVVQKIHVREGYSVQIVPAPGTKPPPASPPAE
jgi:hypothetical protein